MIVIGVDPGLSGGIAQLRPSLPPNCAPMPTIGTNRRELDCVKIREQFMWAKTAATMRSSTLHVWIEKQQAMPKQGVSSTYRIGENYGVLVGICVGLGVPYTIVPPKTWQRVMHSGVNRKLDTKAKSVLVVQREFPNVNLLATPRCKKPHDGMADALLIAEFGRRQLRE